MSKDFSYRVAGIKSIDTPAPFLLRDTAGEQPASGAVKQHRAQLPTSLTPIPMSES